MYKKLFLCFVLFVLPLSLQAQTKEELTQAFPAALAAEEFVLYFQPICKFNKNKICGAEVLTRWDKDGKLISPGKFIPLFEENGFIKALDAYVLNNTLKYMNAWQKEGLQIGFISVNISAKEVDDLEFVEYLKALIAKYNIAPNMLVIEITETAEIKNQKAAREFMTALKGLGIKVALDDFGDGYADLDNLKTFPYDIIKLSKKLLNFKDKETKKEFTNTVKTLKNFSLPIIAEGIEYEQEAKFLKKQGITYAQGYLYYKPMPENDFKKLLSKDLPKYCKF